MSSSRLSSVLHEREKTCALLIHDLCFSHLDPVHVQYSGKQKCYSDATRIPYFHLHWYYQQFHPGSTSTQHPQIYQTPQKEGRQKILRQQPIRFHYIWQLCRNSQLWHRFKVSFMSVIMYSYVARFLRFHTTSFQTKQAVKINWFSYPNEITKNSPLMTSFVGILQQSYWSPRKQPQVQAPTGCAQSKCKAPHRCHHRLHWENFPATKTSAKSPRKFRRSWWKLAEESCDFLQQM